MSKTAWRREAVVGATWLLTVLACEPNPAPLKARLYRAGSPAVPLAQGERLAVGDELFLVLELAGSLHVYALNEDAAGVATLLFPCRGLDRGSSLEAGTDHRLPGNLAAAQTFWTVGEATTRERIWVVAGERPVTELESVLAAAPWAAPCAAPLGDAAGSLREALREAALRLQPRSRESDGAREARRIDLPAAGESSVWAVLFELTGGGGELP